MAVDDFAVGRAVSGVPGVADQDCRDDVLVDVGEKDLPGEGGVVIPGRCGASNYGAQLRI
jgi:hypothetical protein